jgi:hypothetical protein
MNETVVELPLGCGMWYSDEKVAIVILGFCTAP